MKKYLSMIIIGSLLIVVMILILVLTFRKPNTIKIIEPFDDSSLKEEIKEHKKSVIKWEAEASKWKKIAQEASQKNDELEQLKNKLKKDNEKIHTFINDADINQLDSIIRANI